MHRNAVRQFLHFRFIKFLAGLVGVWIDLIDGKNANAFLAFILLGRRRCRNVSQ